MKFRFNGSKGFTLIELMVVMVIMSALAAIVVPQVTGVAALGKGTAKAQDVSQVQQAVARYNVDSGKWPVRISANNPAGKLPDNGSVPIDWDAKFPCPNQSTDVNCTGNYKYLSIGTSATKNKGAYIFGNVKHAIATRDRDDTTGSILQDKDLTDTNPDATTVTTAWSSSDTTNSGTIAVWRINSVGNVYVNLTDNEY